MVILKERSECFAFLGITGDGVCFFVFEFNYFKQIGNILLLDIGILFHVPMETIADFLVGKGRRFKHIECDVPINDELCSFIRDGTWTVIKNRDWNELIE